MNDQRAAIRKALNDDESAIAFIDCFYYIADVWDDLIDKDKPVSDQQINDAFWSALITLPRNPFYVKHFFELSPVMAVDIQNWFAANHLSTSKNQTLRRAGNVLRNRVFDLVLVCSRIIGGVAHAQEHGMVLAEFFYDEPLTEDLQGV